MAEKYYKDHRNDFILDEETGTARGITDDEKAMIGGMITAKNVKYTKQNKAMAFLTVEDLYWKCGSHCISEGV